MPITGVVAEIEWCEKNKFISSSSSSCDSVIQAERTRMTDFVVDGEEEEEEEEGKSR